MKWLARKGTIPTNDPDEKVWFHEIDLKEADGDPKLRKELEYLGFEEWVKYPGPENQFKPLPKIGTNTKRKYEIFCGGFLYYHDVKLKKYQEGKAYYTDEKGITVLKDYPDPTFEHKIYFEWFKEKGEDMVRIHINSTPEPFNANPPKPPPPPPPES